MTTADAAFGRDVITPPKPSPGDRIAIVSPSSGLPELFPQPYELGLERLRTDFASYRSSTRHPENGQLAAAAGR